MNNYELAEITKSVRKKLKISQKELAVRIGTNQTEISFIERGFIPREDRISAIKEIYNDIKKGD